MPSGSEINYDPEFGSGVTIINNTDIPDEDVTAALQELPEVAQLVRWGQSLRTRNGGLFQRDRYSSPQGVFEEIRMAQEAAETDDVVSNVVETTEQLAFNNVKIRCENVDEEDIWAQIMEDLDIVQRCKEIWRELFISSMAYPAHIVGRKEEPYRVRGKTKTGRKSKKSFKELTVPLGITLLDPLKVVPVGNFMFGQGQLAYIANEAETSAFDTTLAGGNSSDLVVTSLIKGKYEPKDGELKLIRAACGETSINMRSNNLYLLNPENVFSITSTKPAYQRFPAVRMKSVFELLDIKAQLREMDRAHILGSTNFIILVKKGSDAHPAKQSEMDRLTAQVRSAARVPVIIGDHRTEIEIITPKTDKTLSPERYNSLDSRITSRLYQLFNTGNYSSGTATDDSIKLIRVVARSMEARRNLIRDAIMKNIIMPIFEANDSLTSTPSMKFYPGRISLDFDPNISTYLADARALGDVSRYTSLAEIGLDEDEEAMLRRREKELYDKDFPPIQVPFSSPPGGATGDPKQDPQDEQPQDQQDPKVVPGKTKPAGRIGGGHSNGGGNNRQAKKSGPPRGPAASK